MTQGDNTLKNVNQESVVGTEFELPLRISYTPDGRLFGIEDTNGVIVQKTHSWSKIAILLLTITNHLAREKE